MSEYLTVSQYAEASGKDPGNVRRMLIKGILQGEKIGNQWLIPKNTVYPEDRRVKSGEYRNWRQTDESDIDMAIVLKANQTDEQYDQLTDVVVDYELDIGITLSIISIEKNEFKEWKNTLPFYKNLAKEGIVLWKNE